MLEWKTLTLSVSAGAQGSTEWAPERDITIRKILVREESGNSLLDVHAKIEISDTPMTRETIPLDLLDAEWNQVPELNYKLPKGVKIKFTVSNDSSAAVALRIVLAYE